MYCYLFFGLFSPLMQIRLASFLYSWQSHNTPLSIWIYLNFLFLTSICATLKRIYLFFSSPFFLTLMHFTLFTLVLFNIHRSLIKVHQCHLDNHFAFKISLPFHDSDLTHYTPSKTIGPSTYSKLKYYLAHKSQLLRWSLWPSFSITA